MDAGWQITIGATDRSAKVDLLELAQSGKGHPFPNTNPQGMGHAEFAVDLLGLLRSSLLR
ncbi:MAG TPA: hypothetical protein VFG81_11575 [Anaerolineales bacterium]|jgi:hypothetical protein|nr:hypothetical protein [Anaerolineales bacterium]